MQPFEFQEPRSLAEALALLDPEDPEVRPFSGGTALMLMMKTGVFQPSRLVSLQKIEPAHSAIAVAEDGAVTIGALATLSEIERCEAALRAHPVLRPTLRRLSNVRVRNVARIGGNLAHGDPHMCLPPVLSALGASVTISGPGGERTLAVEDLYVGYYETALARDELITAVHIPAAGGSVAAYSKVTTKTADDWPALGVAVRLRAEGGSVRTADIFVSAATEKVIRLPAVEALLNGAAPEDELLRRAGEAAAEEAETIADARGSAAYKRELLRVYVGRTIRRALEQAGGTA